MPRPLVYGNGRLAIAFDSRHQARDLSWPNVGCPNHLLGHALRVGVWCDSEFSWCDSDEWERAQGYEPQSMVGDSVWRSWRLGLEINVLEAVHPEAPAFVRRFLVRDLRGSVRSVRLFQTQNLILGQSDVGNTAFFNPFVGAMVHYRGPYLALATGAAQGLGIAQYATGITGFGGMEGTWRDAEDGELSGNAIAQGSVDSTFGLEMTVEPLGEAEAWTTLVMGDRLDDASERLELVRALGWEGVASLAREADHAWLGRAAVTGLAGLSDAAQDLFWRSLLVIRTQIDHDGAVVAANDSDILETNRATYSYCWPRDGALVARTLARTGFPEIAERFVAFCARVAPHDQAFLLQKYRSDGSLGASWHSWVVDGRPEVPFQEDETALTVLAIESCRPDERQSAWEAFGRRAAEFLVSHTSADGLPLPSFDLWEERRGVHFFTVCTVVAALEAAARMEPDGQFLQAAETMLARAQAAFFDPEKGRYGRMLGGSGLDATPDSAVVGGMLLLGLGRFDRAESTIEALAAELAVDGPTGGYARYKGDYYFRKSDAFPGNPWVISTLWFARARAALGQTDALDRAIEWAVERSRPTGILAEQYHPVSGQPLSVSPLTWSHAEYVETVLTALERRQDS